MGEKPFSQIFLYGHELNPLSLDQPQNIHDIRRLYEDAVYSIGQKHLRGFIQCPLNRLEDLTHVLLNNND
jgi:hypothetical protein